MCALLLSTSPGLAQFSWESSNVGNTSNLLDIVMPTARLAVVVGDQVTIGRSTDGGVSWTLQTSGTTLSLSAVTFIDSLNGWSAGGNVLRYSTDGGITWHTPVTLPSLGAKAIAFGNRNVGAAVGTGGQILQSTDGGVHWAMVVSSVSSSLFGVTYADSITAIAVGNRKICRSTDGGKTWSSTTGPLLYAVAAASQQVVIAVGGTPSVSFVYRSTNAGVTWDSLGGLAVPTLSSVAFCSADTGFTLASNGKILRTVNAGATWDSVSGVSSTAGATNISFRSGRTGLTCGSGGAVYRTTSSTASVSMTEPFAQQFVLNQNYPNPFNPSTTIGYGLPNRSHVTLTVFNMLGEQVAVLQNEEQEGGYHEVKFDGADLSSGVYFYRIQSGDFFQTRKLVFLR